MKVTLRRKGNNEKKVFEIIPLHGISWNGQALSFGDSAEQVRAVLGKPEVADGAYFYFDSDLVIQFDHHRRVEFFGFVGGKEGSIDPVLCGMHLFATDGDLVVEELKRCNGDDMVLGDHGHSLLFLQLSVCLYREQTPSDVDAAAAELVERGENIADYAVAEQKSQASRWTSLGVGREGYYEASLK
jgi:hypothetical protein